MSVPLALPLRTIARKFTMPRVKIKAPAAVRNLAKMPLTITGIASIVTAVILISLVAGLIVLGVFLIILEALIADEV